MTAVNIAHVRRLLLKALALREIDAEDAEFIAADYIDAQLAGKSTHGLGKFLLLDAALAERQGSPLVVTRSRGSARVDGRRSLGQVAGRYCVRLLHSFVDEHAIGMVSLFNSSRFARLEPYGRLIANQGLIGVVTNSAGPPAVAPFGSIDPVLGTNPICFAFPSVADPLIVDFSTSERVWGEIRQAVLENRPLPDDAFLDERGGFTTDPNAVNAVLPFGNHRGSALCVVIELLAAILASGNVGLEVSSEYECGAVFVGIDPSNLFPDGARPDTVEVLRRAIRGSRSATDIPVVAPGDRSSTRRAEAMATGKLDVDSETLSRLEQMSVSIGGGLKSSDRLN
jgi:LDH2 family malate/lactate/ureidoglycolate dehydrogenase